MTRTAPVPALVLLAPFAAIALTAAGAAHAATPTYYNNLATFQADITSTVTDTYSNPGYVFSQNNVVMSGILGETDYFTTGHNNNNLVYNAPADPRYCAGCNGSFQLSFQTTTVGNAAGVNGVGVFIEAHDMGTPYFAYITFADGTTANIALPAAGSFWGVAAPERIQQIHFGLAMGGITTNGSFGIDDLIVGDGNVGGCSVDTDCFDGPDPCTDPVCVAGMCEFAFNVAPCDDGDICTEMDTCADGVCGGSTLDCDDGNVCTTNFCDSNAGCVLQLNMEPCDDGDSCTEQDICAAGACAGAVIDCNDDNVCSMDSCVQDMGCVNEATPGCCLTDQDCGDEETCDLDTNTCVPSSASTTTGDPGDSSDSSDSGPGDTGLDGSAGESGVVTTGFDASSSDTGGSTSGDTGLPADGGTLPTPDFSVCECTTTPNPQDRLWLLMAGLGLFLRRRRRAG